MNYTKQNNNSNFALNRKKKKLLVIDSNASKCNQNRNHGKCIYSNYY